MKKTVLALCGILALSMASCTSCKEEEKRGRRHHPRKHMRFRSHIEKMRFSPEMRKKVHERNKKQHKKG